jgi:hypothetical protein
MFPANCIHQEVEMFPADLLPLSCLRSSKSQIDSRSFLFVFYVYVSYIYPTNSSEFFMYIIKLNRIALRKLVVYNVTTSFFVCKQRISTKLLPCTHVHKCKNVHVYMLLFSFHSIN